MGKPTFLGPLVGKSAGEYELVNAESGSVLATNVEPAFDSATRKRGLLGRDSVPEDYALIIAPCGSVHTFFMRFPIDAVFVTRDGTIVKTCRSVKPWRMAGALRAFAVIEAAPGFIDRADLVPGEVVSFREIQQARRAPKARAPLLASSTPGGGLLKARHNPPVRHVTLADITARGTSLAWYESVAIVQELCSVVLARGPAKDLRVPELKHVALNPDGGVHLLAEGPAGHSAVHRAALVLLALTEAAQLPTQLRLLALEEVSPAPRFTSLKEFHSELEFFERPDRLEIVRGVYERFRHHPAQPGMEVVIPPPLLEPPAPRPRRQHWWKRRRARAGIGAVLMTLLVAGVTWEWSRPEGQWVRSGVEQFSKTAIGAAREVVRTARYEIGVAKWELGLSKQAPDTLPAPTASKPAAGREAGPDGTVSAGPLPQPQPIAGVSAPQPPPADPSRAAEIAPSQPVGRDPGAGAQAGQLAATATAVYTAADPQVVPPVLVRPSRPVKPPEGVGAIDVAEVEIVISITGEVESVRLLSPWNGPQPAMLLSAIKAWAFQPATRGGQAVRYRQRLQVSTR